MSHWDTQRSIGGFTTDRTNAAPVASRNVIPDVTQAAAGEPVTSRTVTITDDAAAGGAAEPDGATGGDPPSRAVYDMAELARRVHAAGSQRKLAERAGIDQGSISKAINGKLNSPAKVAKLAAAVGLEPLK